MTLLYFAWVRERIGVGEEALSLPDGVTDLAGLIRWLEGRSDGHAAALSDQDRIRYAVNQVHVDPAAQPGWPVHDGDEIAIFPPVTGG